MSHKNVHKGQGKAVPQVAASSVKNVNQVPPISNPNQINPNSKRVLKAQPLTAAASKDISPNANSFKPEHWAISARVQNQPGQFGVQQNQIIAQSPQVQQQQPLQYQRNESKLGKKKESKQEESKPAKWIQKISNLYLFRRKGSDMH